MKEPPLLVLFPSIERYLSALDSVTREADEESIRKLCSLRLPAVTSTTALGVLFGFRPQFIGTIRRRPHRYYNRFEIRKGRKTRRIQAPRVALKVIQKWFGHHLSRAITLPEYVVGFVPGRSAIEGASQHCGADWIFSTDIESFFQTTPLSIVADSLMELGYSEGAATLMADLNCLGGALAQGSPASPVLANISMSRIDKRLSQIAEQYNAKYTRYADDITISGRGPPPEGLREKVEQVFEPTCWTLAEHKTRTSTKPHRLKVYGLLVQGESPRLTKGYRKRIRAIEHQLTNGKVLDIDLARARGHLSYAKYVEDFLKSK